jgi:hypothetical protein
MMAQIVFSGNLPKPIRNEANRIKQGDYIFCKGNAGTGDFWGIYSQELGVISLNGAGSSYIPVKEKIYLGETYNYWTITKRIPNDKVKVTIEELQ